jgi:CHAT domain-containing protein
MRDHVAICFENISRSRAAAAALFLLAALLTGCARKSHGEPAEIFASTVALNGEHPVVIARSLQRGVYLVEAREHDIDARVSVGASDSSVVLEDRLPRHGAVYRVVSLPAPGEVRISLASSDHATRSGEVLLRISRWSRTPETQPGELETGYAAQSEAARFAAEGTPESWARAADKLHEAVTHFESAGDDAARAAAAYSLAYVQYGPRDQWAAAVRACETAADAYGKAGDQVGLENVATLRAAAEIDLAARMNADTQRAEQKALFAEADRRLADAAVFFTQHGLPVRAQYAVNMRAVRAISVGDYATAADLFSRAVEMARANRDVREEAQSLGNLAAVHIYMGYMAQAAREYEALLPLADRATQPYKYAVLLGNFGVTLIALGDFDRALAVHTEALEIYTRVGKEEERAVELSALGVLYFRIGDTRRALETLRAAIAAQERVSDLQGLTSTLRVAGNAASVLDQHTAALEYLRWSARIDANPHSVARTRVLIAGELRTLGDLSGAEAELAEPLRSTNKLVLASALEERARLHLARHAPRAAIEDLRAADGNYAALGLEFNRIDTNTALSRTLLDSGDVHGAAVAADEAIEIVSRIRVKSANPEWRARFLSARYSPYEARISADLAEGGTGAAWRAFRTAEEVRGRSLADELAVSANGAGRASLPGEEALRVRLTAQQLRLESRIQRSDMDEEATHRLQREIAETRAQIDALRSRHGVAAAAKPALSESLEEVQRSLPSDAAVLAYFVGDASGHAWLLTRRELRHKVLPGTDVLERAIVAAQREERAGAADGPASRELANLLLHGILDGVDERKLLILADGPLNSVPFAALPDVAARKPGQLLVDRFVMVNAASLALAMSGPSHPRSRHTRVAVVSDPVYAADDRRLRVAANGASQNLRGQTQPSVNNLTRLPFSALEASAVAKAFGAADTIELSGFDAVPTRVLQLPAKDLAVLHFATHAVARADSPEQSALYLSEYSPDGTLLPSSRITVTDIARSGLRADVVVLSGCATGGGSALRGEGVLGLTYGFLANGSESVVASLWPIEDASTARFMNEFYRAYRESGRAADALRAAQLRARVSASSGVWSSFVVRANEFP